MALGLTQPLIEMSTRNRSCGGKGGRCVGLSTLPPSRDDCLEIWEPQPLGTLEVLSRTVQGSIYFIIIIIIIIIIAVGYFGWLETLSRHTAFCSNVHCNYPHCL